MAGTVVVDQGANESRIAAIAYGKTGCEVCESVDIAAIRGLRKQQPAVLWVHVTGLGCRDSIVELGREFGLHPLALEDVVKVHQQVKVEDYPENLFMVTRLLIDSMSYQTQQCCLFVGTNFVISFEESPSPLFGLIEKRLEDSHSQLRERGSDFLAYVMLDFIVDQYFPLLEVYGRRLDSLEEQVADHPSHHLLRQIHDIRVEIRTIRRVIWQHRESLSRLLRDDTTLITSGTRIYLRDCHDHTIQLLELLEVFHENCSDLRDAYSSAMSNRMNEIMMVLTIIATIFIPLSFVTGLYGMNFNPRTSPYNMPELDWYFGYPLALGLMASIVAGLLGFFYRRGWIGKREPLVADREE